MACFYSGTSNIELIEKNKLAFPPEHRGKSRLAYYATLFNSVEINNSFYRLPRPATLERWAKEVPAGFRFSLKLWRDITHSQGLAFLPEQVDKFMQIADHIGERKGGLLVQLPAGTRIGSSGNILLDRLDDLLARVQARNEGGGWQVAVEFRHPGWYIGPVYSMLAARHATLVWHDRPPRDDEGRQWHGSFIYLRFHGPGGGEYTGSYPDEFLSQQASRIRSFLDEGRNVYAYFNNTIAGDAPHNLRTLNKMVKSMQTPSLR
jgi:uncharacterized protein YecE (DUF72 family)